MAGIGPYQETINDSSTAIKLKTDYADAYYLRGVAYSRLGNHQQATADFKIAARLGYIPAQEYLKQLGVDWQ